MNKINEMVYEETHDRVDWVLVREQMNNLDRDVKCFDLFKYDETQSIIKNHLRLKIKEMVER